jgi:hypothetical protein
MNDERWVDFLMMITYGKIIPLVVLVAIVLFVWGE